MAIAPFDELVTAFKVTATATQRLGVVESIDKTSTSAWLAEVTIGADPTPRPMRYTGGHQLQEGERVIWADNGSSLPVVLGRASSSEADQNYTGGQVDAAAYVDPQGNLRVGITSVDVKATTTATGLTTTNQNLGVTNQNLGQTNNNLQTTNNNVTAVNSGLNAVNSTVNGQTTTLASYGSRISTLENWRGGYVDPNLSSHQSSINSLNTSQASQDTVINNHAGRLNTLDNWKATLQGGSGWMAWVEGQLSGLNGRLITVEQWKGTLQGPSGWMAFVEARLHSH